MILFAWRWNLANMLLALRWGANVNRMNFLKPCYNPFFQLEQDPYFWRESRNLRQAYLDYPSLFFPMPTHLFFVVTCVKLTISSAIMAVSRSTTRPVCRPIYCLTAQMPSSNASSAKTTLSNRHLTHAVLWILRSSWSNFWHRSLKNLKVKNLNGSKKKLIESRIFW